MLFYVTGTVLSTLHSLSYEFIKTLKNPILYNKICFWRISREFLGGPVVRTCTSTGWALVQSLVRELRSHKLYSTAKVCVCVYIYIYIYKIKLIQEIVNSQWRLYVLNINVDYAMLLWSENLFELFYELRSVDETVH